jgi:predicted dehydrogenase
MRLIDAPVPRVGRASALVGTRVSLISAGTEKQIIDLARASLAGKAIARPDLVRQTVRKVKAEGLLPVARKVFAKLDTPIPLGYSLAGEVVETGQDSGFAVGDRVACAGAGIANHAEFNAVPRNLCVRIPTGVDDESASFVTLGAIALQGVRVANPTLGERVVVMGLGLIGLLTVQLLKANGCRVLGFDPNPARADLARELGADVAVSLDLVTATASFTNGIGADAVILAASSKSSEPLNQAAEISRLKGRVVVVGLVGMTMEREAFYQRELDLRLSMSYGPGRHDPAYEVDGQDYPFAYVRWTEQRNMEAFLELVAAGQVTPRKLISHRFPIQDAKKAYAVLDGDEPYLAILLTYDDAAAVPNRLVSRGPAAIPADGEVAFIGFGNYARSVLLPAFKSAGGSGLRTVVTSTGISAHGAAESAGFSHASTDPEEVFSDPAVSTIFIATRHDSHADLTVRGLRAGKNVFVEKPLALTRDELEAVMTAARDAPGHLMVGFNRRFAPMIEDAKRAIGQRSGPLNMLYRINAGPIPRQSWVHGSQGGGRIIGEVCHFVDTLAAICGSAPIEVEPASPAELPDSLAATLRFADGSVATILYSSIGDPAVPKERIEIFAPGMVLEIEDFSRLSISRGGRTVRKKRSQDKGQAAMIRAFLAALRGRGDPPISLDDLRAVSAASLSLAGG